MKKIINEMFVEMIKIVKKIIKLFFLIILLSVSIVTIFYLLPANLQNEIKNFSLILTNVLENLNRKLPSPEWLFACYIASIASFALFFIIQNLIILIIEVFVVFCLKHKFKKKFSDEYCNFKESTGGVQMVFNVLKLATIVTSIFGVYIVLTKTGIFNFVSKFFMK